MPRVPAVPTADRATEARPSKTQLKAMMHELQSLGEALVALPETRLAEIGLPERLLDAIAEYRTTRSHEGRRRQMQYVGKLMRGIDPEPLREAVAHERLPNARETLALHRVEHWRDALIADDEALTRFVAEHTGTDSAALRRLVRAARSEPVVAVAQGRDESRFERRGRHYRELFRFLKEALRDD